MKKRMEKADPDQPLHSMPQDRRTVIAGPAWPFGISSHSSAPTRMRPIAGPNLVGPPLHPGRTDFEIDCLGTWMT
jgi:hypothetical protein